MDINKDGINDVRFELSSWTSPGITSYTSNIIALGSAQLIGANSSSVDIDMLTSGFKITQFRNWTNNERLYSSITTTLGGVNTYGIWQLDQKRYVGVKLEVSQTTRYGWIGLSVNSDSSLFIYDYAFTKPYF